MTDKREGLDPKAVEAASRAIREGGSYEVMAQAAIRAYLGASAPVPAEPVQGERTEKRKHGYTVNLTEEEMDALESLSKESDLPPWRVLLQGLRLYQLTAHPVDLGPMLPPEATTAPNRDELIAALEFYAHGFAATGHDRYYEPTRALLDDCGQTARAALRALRESKQAAPQSGSAKE